MIFSLAAFEAFVLGSFAFAFGGYLLFHALRYGHRLSVGEIAMFAGLGGLGILTGGSLALLALASFL